MHLCVCVCVCVCVCDIKSDYPGAGVFAENDTFLTKSITQGRKRFISQSNDIFDKIKIF